MIYGSHAEYNPYQKGYDVAALILHTAIDFWRYYNIRPICVPNHGQLLDRDKCVVAGWHAAPKKLTTQILLSEPKPYSRLVQHLIFIVQSIPPSLIFLDNTQILDHFKLFGILVSIVQKSMK
jgi:hypothetical protein